VHAGVAQRFRVINMTTRRPNVSVELWRDSTPLTWRPLAKDGADLRAEWQGARTARAAISIGETMDFEFTTVAAGDARLVVRAQTGVILAAMPVKVIATP
jgi:hypothetical protein